MYTPYIFVILKKCTKSVAAGKKCSLLVSGRHITWRSTHAMNLSPATDALYGSVKNPLSLIVVNPSVVYHKLVVLLQQDAPLGRSSTREAEGKSWDMLVTRCNSTSVM